MPCRIKLWLYIITAGSIVLTLAGVVNSLGHGVSLVFAIGYASGAASDQAK